MRNNKNSHCHCLNFKTKHFNLTHLNILPKAAEITNNIIHKM